MPTASIEDFNIRYVGHPKYNQYRITEDRTIEFIVQKLEMLLFTNKGDVLDDPDFGINLEYYLWSTNVPVDKIRSDIINQINIYIPELNQLPFNIDTQIYEGTAKDILYINITIKDTVVNFILK